MLKRLKTSVVLIILGEILLWMTNLSDGSDFSEFTSGLLLGLSVGMKLIGIILLVISMAKYKEKKLERTTYGKSYRSKKFK